MAQIGSQGWKGRGASPERGAGARRVRLGGPGGIGLQAGAPEPGPLPWAGQGPEFHQPGRGKEPLETSPPPAGPCSGAGAQEVDPLGRGGGGDPISLT